MDAYRDVFRWHEKFAPLTIEPGGVLLLSEGDALLFTAPGIVDLAQVLARGDSLEAVSEEAVRSGRLALMLHALESLARQGHVRAVSADGERYAVPVVSAPCTRLLVSDDVGVINLSCGLDETAAEQWARDIPGPLTVVYCDDLLDPRLEAIGGPWLLVKPTGAALIGPLFRPHERGTACWHCLAERLRRNQPVRAWWKARQGAWPGVPVRCDEPWVNSRLKALRPLVPRLLAQRTQYILSLEADAVRKHAVVPRPQCPACGDAGLLAERQRRPVVLASGRVRSISPESTVERLCVHVSPLCGVVSHLDLLAADEGGHVVHRSGFFKTPRVDEAPLPTSFTQRCLGRGSTAAQSQASALCEAVERYAAFHQGDEAFVEVLPPGERCIRPHELVPMSDAQAAVRWAPAWSLTRQARCYLPLGYCYAHAPAEDARCIGWTSNGCAAGNTLEEAIVHGFLELVERDAVAVWWYGRIERPAFETSRDRWVLDLTHDLGIPVAAAVERHRDTGGWALGFGCAFSAARACERALTELAQLVAADKCIAAPPGDFVLPYAHAAPAPQRPAIAHPTVDDCVQAAAACGLETIVLDHSRPDIPLHTVKVVVPGLSHIWPGLTTDRVDDVPVKLGWRDRRSGPRERNPQPLFV